MCLGKMCLLPLWVIICRPILFEIKKKKKTADLPQENIKDITDVISCPKLKLYRRYTMAKWLSSTNPHKIRGRTQVLLMGRQFLLHHCHPWCYSWKKAGITSWMTKWRHCDDDKRNISRGHLWHRYPVTIN